MSYLIYDEDGELVDVLEFNSLKELESYKQHNPQYNVEYPNISSEPLFEDEDYIDENTYYEDDINLELW